MSDAFELDNALNYSVAEIPAAASPYAADSASEACRRTAEQALAVSGITRGYCLEIISTPNGQATGRSFLMVHVFCLPSSDSTKRGSS